MQNLVREYLRIPRELDETIICHCYDKLGNNGSNNYADGINQPNFHSFVEGNYGRHGWMINDKMLLEHRTGTDPIDRPWDIDVFLQRWLYYEVLDELFHELPGFSLHEFTTVQHDRKLVNTKDLKKWLLKLKETFRSGDEGWTHEQKKRMLRLQDILTSARSYIRGCRTWKDAESAEQDVPWLVTDVFQQPQTFATPTIDQNVILSIVLLGEVLFDALRKIQKDTNGLAHLKSWACSRPIGDGWGYSPHILKAFQDECFGGESPEMRRLQLRFRNNTNALLYAVAILKPEPPEQPSKLDYHNYHKCVDLDSGNELVKPENYAEVFKILRTKEEDFPLFKYDTSNAVPTLTAHSGKAAMKRNEGFVVVSHVWTDGFSNPYDNSVCSCLLKLIAGLFPTTRALSKDTFKRNTLKSRVSSHLFWIDTLGIPVFRPDGDTDQNLIRNRAVQSMHNVYVYASCTLVLDRAWLGRTRGEGYPDAAMRITLSRWSRRLWTLQEAVLSKKLCFYFKDEACSVQEIEASFEKENSKLHVSIASLARQYLKCMLWEEAKAEELPGINSLAGRRLNAATVGRVWKAVQWRTTAYPSHETLALALLFGLATDRFADSNNTRSLNPKGQDFEDKDWLRSQLDGRMRDFLIALIIKEQEAIPVEFIFLPGPYLPYKGWGWAPGSWLASDPTENPNDYRMEKGFGTLMISDPHGLEVTLSGFTLEGLKENMDLLTNENKENFCFPTDSYLQDWYRVERKDPSFLDAVAISQWPSSRSKKDKNPKLPDNSAVSIVCQPSLDLSEPRVALLVLRSNEDNRTWILSRVTIQKIGNSVEQQRETASYRMAREQQLCWGIPVEKRKWLVDRLPPSAHPEKETAESSLTLASTSGFDHLTAYIKQAIKMGRN